MSTTPIAIKAHEAARLLGISRRTVQLLAKRGQIPHRRVGKLYLFSPHALQEWMNKDADQKKIESDSHAPYDTHLDREGDPIAGRRD